MYVSGLNLFVQICTCMYLYHVSRFVLVCIDTCTHVHPHVHVYTCSFRFVHVLIHVLVHVHLHYTCTCTCRYVRLDFSAVLIKTILFVNLNS